MRLYLNWPIFLTILLICMNLSILTVDKTAAGLMAIFVLIYAVIAFLLYFVKKPLIVNELIRFAAGYSQVQRRLLKELAVPYAVMDTEGSILWANDEFMDLAELSPKTKNIKSIIPEITADYLPTVENDVSLHVEIKERNYHGAIVLLSEAEDIAKHGGYNAYVVFGIYSDLEICYKQLYNFEKAYLYSTKRMSMLEGFKS